MKMRIAQTARRCCTRGADAVCACMHASLVGVETSPTLPCRKTHQVPLQHHQMPKLNESPQLNHFHQLQSSCSPAPTDHNKDSANQLKWLAGLWSVLASFESRWSFLHFLQQTCAGKTHYHLDLMIYLANRDLTSVLITAEALERLAQNINHLVNRSPMSACQSSGCAEFCCTLS